MNHLIDTVFVILITTGTVMVVILFALFLKLAWELFSE